MTELRWILLAIGAAVVAGVYWWSRRTAMDADDAEPTRVEPRLEPTPVAASSDGVDAEPEPVYDSDAPTVQYSLPESGDQLTIPMPDDVVEDEPAGEDAFAAPDRVIRLNVVARDGTSFLAADIVGALRAEGLRFAHHDVFHKFVSDGNPASDEAPLFSVSDMLRPGTFDLETLAERQLQGVSLFMALPNVGDAVAVFAEMLATGRRLAATFGGLLVDERGCAVSRQSASHMREDIINYQLEARKAGEQEE